MEFAIIASLFLILLFGMIDFGFGLHAFVVTGNGSREGARLGAINPSVVAIEQRVRETASSLSGANDPAILVVTIQCRPINQTTGQLGPPGPCPPSASSWTEGDDIIVNVEYLYDLLTPLGSLAGIGSPLHFTSKSEARFEGQ